MTRPGARSTPPDSAVGRKVTEAAFEEKWTVRAWRYLGQGHVAAYLAAGLLSTTFLAIAALNLAGRVTTLGSVTLPAFAFLDFLGLAFVALAVPFGVKEYLESRRIVSIEERLPDLLSDLASLHRAGLTLMDAIHVAASGSYGALTEDVRRASAQIKWGVPVLDAITMMRDRLATPVVNRTLTVVIEAGHAGGRVDEVLTVAADVARRLSIMRKQRQQEMFLYLLIVYVASLVFLFVVLALQGVFVPKMIDAVSGASGGGIFGVGGIPSAGDFRGLYVTAALVQAIGNGFVGGVMGEGRVDAGVKHAALMVLLSLGAFALFG